MQNQQNEMESLCASNAQLACQLQEQEEKINEELAIVLSTINQHLAHIRSLCRNAQHHFPNTPVQQQPVPSAGLFASYEVMQPTPHQRVRDSPENAQGGVDIKLKLI
jgi:hypothetical protein